MARLLAPGIGILVAAAIVAALAVFASGRESGGGLGPQTAARQVSYGQIQSLFAKYGCTSCHPFVNPSLNLQPGRSYADLVGVRALEDPRLYRVVAGDPDKSFLLLKVGGDPAVADIPAIGGRMPPGAAPIAQADMNLIRTWIEEGAKGPNGKTGGPAVLTPGSPPTGLAHAQDASRPTGSGTISGTVIDQERRPIAGALVTILLKGPSQPGGEEHYRVAETDAAGRFMLEHTPVGRFLLKAYAPDTIYVSRLVALDRGQTQEIDFGLPNRVIANPKVSRAAVRGRQLSMQVGGQNLDGNYTLAANPRTGLVFELHNSNDAPGRWSRTIPKRLAGPWVFLAVDHQCDVSRFLTVTR